ncbi:3-isopropylmalate/(R)-2-methylmalate dehydratase large subunit [Sulfitobacter brevis]|uniref:3-isopropylmalate dehydratase n=1 Tax=Sulfitobacter brevis TaxID=74348 RepID=A0A1I1WSC1_9RHOB|nr:3-isopropylmalate dehydratase large subunit [Sulfitobacter brevis]SFD95980.1 3-isopropylmalate/(R)-2-methylmalate dehydratase large subunit [Sulfitobacter brevis]
MSDTRTLTEPRGTVAKIREAHRILAQDGTDLLYIDRHFLHEGSHHAFASLREAGRSIRQPALTFGVADHYVPSSPERANEVTATMIDRLDRNTRDFGIDSFGIGDPRRGIVHVAMPEQGLSLPGTTIVCGDSHTATHGAFGAFAFGIGASEVAHVLATQTLWQMPMPVMRIRIEGQLPTGATAKDLALTIIWRIGTGGATGHAVEYDGSAVAALSMEERMTLCNMTIEMGARSGLVPPDDTTFEWLKGRPMAPKGKAWKSAVAEWRALRPDPNATYDKEILIDADDVSPMVTWGTSPEQVAPVDAAVPADADPDALDYMGLAAGVPLTTINIDRAFIGSCTNGRLSDLRAAAVILSGRRVVVPLLVSPGSDDVARQAESEGIAEIFRAAGAEWGASGCSLCVSMNGDLVASNERCASTSNRNFKGRQGPGARTHLMSPQMVAAAAITGRITDARTMAPQDCLGDPS